MDYHCLDQLLSNLFNKVYIIETFIYITDPKLVLH